MISAAGPAIGVALDDQRIEAVEAAWHADRDAATFRRLRIDIAEMLEVLLLLRRPVHGDAKCRTGRVSDPRNVRGSGQNDSSKKNGARTSTPASAWTGSVLAMLRHGAAQRLSSVTSCSGISPVCCAPHLRPRDRGRCAWRDCHVDMASLWGFLQVGNFGHGNAAIRDLLRQTRLPRGDLRAPRQARPIFLEGQSRVYAARRRKVTGSWHIMIAACCAPRARH